jgi:pancreatic triacylglycerol lipase
VHSVELFTESINSKCPFQSIICDSYESFKKGKCKRCNRNGHFCVKFGFHSYHSYLSLFNRGFTYPGYRTEINAFLMTSEKEPYCKTHFNVFVKIAENDESRIHGGEIGFLYLKLIGTKGEGSKFKLNQQAVFFQPGSNHTFLGIGDDVVEIKSVTVDYKYMSTVNPLTWRVFTPKIYVEYLEIESMEHGGYIKVCPHHALPISSGEGLLFREDSCGYRRDIK